MVTSRLGDVWGRVLLADVVLAAFVCTLAIQTATTRMIYSMSRDEVLPFSRLLRKVSPRGGATVNAAILVGVLAAAAAAGQPRPRRRLHRPDQHLHRAALPGVPLRDRAAAVPPAARAGPPKLGPQNDEDGKPVFSLGRWGLPINILAVVYGPGHGDQPGLAPRRRSSTRAGTDPVLQYFAIIVLAVTGDRRSDRLQRQEARLPPGDRRAAGSGHPGRGWRTGRRSPRPRPSGGTRSPPAPVRNQPRSGAMS